MTPFALEPSMLTLGGVFYPTGYMFIMFPTLEDAREAAQRLLDDGYTGEAISLLEPDTVLGQITHTVGSADSPLPSVGTEAGTVRHYAELASLGHHALMIHAPAAQESEHIMGVLRGAKISYAQKYRQLVIEDLVQMPLYPS